MIDLESIREAIAGGLSDYVGSPVIQMNSPGKPPKYPFITYNFTDPEGAGGRPVTLYSNGEVTIKETLDFTVSFHTYSDSALEGMGLALKARDWFRGEGHSALKYGLDVIVVEITKIDTRDVLVEEEWERRKGFEVTFRTTNTVNYTVGTIETANIKGVDPIG